MPDAQFQSAFTPADLRAGVDMAMSLMERAQRMEQERTLLPLKVAEAQTNLELNRQKLDLFTQERTRQETSRRAFAAGGGMQKTYEFVRKFESASTPAQADTIINFWEANGVENGWADAPEYQQATESVRNAYERRMAVIKSAAAAKVPDAYKSPDRNELATKNPGYEVEWDPSSGVWFRTDKPNLTSTRTKATVLSKLARLEAEPDPAKQRERYNAILDEADASDMHPDDYQEVMTAAGGVKFVSMKDPSGSGKLDLNQSNLLQFESRAALAEQQLASIGLDQTGKSTYNPGAAGNIVQDALPNLFRSENRQAYRSAAHAWIQAILRKESGAAIPDSELDKYFETYFPQPGDSEDVAKRKKEMRDNERASFQKILRWQGLEPLSSAAAPVVEDAPADVAAQARAELDKRKRGK